MITADQEQGHRGVTTNQGQCLRLIPAKQQDTGEYNSFESNILSILTSHFTTTTHLLGMINHFPPSLSYWEFQAEYKL